MSMPMPASFVLAAAGGVLIGLAATVLMSGIGRILGASGIAAAIIDAPRNARWQIAFLFGLISAGLYARLFTDAFGHFEITRGTATLILGGLLVGFGSRLGSGCTSGHGICGFARLSPRSFAAVATFMAVAILTVFLTRHAIGG